MSANTKSALLDVSQKRYKEMIKTKKYRSLQSQLTHDKKKDKAILDQLTEMRKEYGLTEYSLHEDVKAIIQSKM